MKKLFINLLLVFTIPVFISCGFNSATQIDIEDSNTTASFVSTVSFPEDDLSKVESDCSYEELFTWHDWDCVYDRYDILSDDDLFYKAMKDIAIDKRIDELFEVAMTTAEMGDAAYNACSMWKEELQYAINEFKKDLSEEDKKSFNKVQTDWEKYIKESYKLESNLMGHGGSDLIYKMPLSLAREYRERTIRIKYMHYIVETNLERPDNELKSVVFKNG